MNLKKIKEDYNPIRIVSAASHGFGALFFLGGTIALVVKATLFRQSFLHYLAFILYGLSAISLYSASTLYHSVKSSIKIRGILKKIDHSMIYVLIAGTYTPICLLAVWQEGGKIMLPLIWVLASLGVVSSSIWIKKPNWLSALLYLGMGWLALTIIKPLWQNLSGPALFLLILGGALYSLGAVLYALRWPGRNHPVFGFHEIFHFFVLAGSFCHFFLIFAFLN